MKDFRLGVVIPVYNRPVELQSALRSVLQQTYLPDQVIVVDDGSDQPITLDQELAASPIVRLVRYDENKGAAAARQYGADLLSVSHLAFLDSDDEWTPTKLSRQVARLQELKYSDLVAVGCGWRAKVSESSLGPEVLPITPRTLTDFVSGCWYCPGSTTIMSKRALDQIGGFDTSLRRLEDFDLFIRFARSGGKLEIVPMCGANIRPGRNATSKHIECAVKIIAEKFIASEAFKLDARDRRHLLAWLAVERAAAARNERNLGTMAANMARSLFLVPRTHVQLKNWLRAMPKRHQLSGS